MSKFDKDMTVSSTTMYADVSLTRQGVEHRLKPGKLTVTSTSASDQVQPNTYLKALMDGHWFRNKGNRPMDEAAVPIRIRYTSDARKNLHGTAI